MAAGTVIVIGGSSGALEALRTIVEGLPGDLAAAIFVVIHTSPETPGIMDRILARAGRLPAIYPRDGDAIAPGRIYLAPPDRHLLVKPGYMRVTRGPRENRFRPAIDPLFRTAAAAYGSRVIGIVLSGGQDDGASGLGAIKHAGGIALVQDPAEAVIPNMPEAAIRHVPVDHILSANDIPSVLTGLVRERLARREMPMTEHPREDVAEVGAHEIHRADHGGSPSPFTCPDCGGALWQSQEGELLQFHCHVGHRFSGDGLTAAQTDALEQAMWTALRALEESAELRRRMATHARERGMSAIAARYEAQGLESEQRAGAIRGVLMPDGRGAAAAELEPAEVQTERG